MSLLTYGSDNPITNVFAPAYIRTILITAADGDMHDNSFFKANVPNLNNYNQVDRRSLFLDYDLTSGNTNDQFWTVFVLGAYQGITDRDNDPHQEAQTQGVVDTITNDLSDGDGEGSGALLFMEINRTKEIEGYSAFPENQLKTIVAHEVGHLFGCKHSQGDLMGDDDDGNPVSLKFSPISLSIIRNVKHP